MSQNHQESVNSNFTLKQLIDITEVTEVSSEDVLSVSYHCSIVLLLKTSFYHQSTTLYTFKHQILVQKTAAYTQNFQLKFMNTSNDIILLQDDFLMHLGFSPYNEWKCWQVLGNIGSTECFFKISDNDNSIIVCLDDKIKCWRNQKDSGWVQFKVIKGRYFHVPEMYGMIFKGVSFQFQQYS